MLPALLSAAPAASAQTLTGAARGPASFSITVATPANPVLTATVPASPSSNPTPSVVGTADPSVPISIFKSSTCTGTAAATGTSDAFGNFSIPVSVNLNTTTMLTARAGTGLSVSGCSNAIPYIHDNIPPGAPAITATTPPSPGSSLNPLVSGTAASGSTVTIYTSGDCSGPPAATTVAGGGVFSVNVSVAAGTTTVLTATAADAAGNLSSCSAPFFYTSDTTPPAPPLLSGTSPASPANNNHPVVSGTAEPGSLVSLYTVAGCGGAVVASGFASGGGTFDIATTVPDNSVTTFYARCADSAGNSSDCSGSGVAYIENSNLASGTVCGIKYEDLNGNGLYEPGLGETGLAGWTIYAVGTQGDTTTAVTDGGGAYCFTTLTDSAYTISEEARPGVMQTGGQPLTSIDFYLTQTYAGVDFGNFTAGQISGTKFEDVSQDGLRDTAEAGLPGWSICLTPASLPPGFQYVPVTAKADLDVTGLGNVTNVSLDGLLLIRRGVLDTVRDLIPVEIIALELQAAAPITLSGQEYRFVLQGGGAAPDAFPFSASTERNHSYGWDPADSGTAAYASYLRTALLLLAPGDSIGTPAGEFHHHESLDLTSNGVVVPYPPGTLFTGSSVVLRDSLDQAAGSLALASLTLGSGNSPLCTRTDTAGRYAFAGLPPGLYSVAEVQQGCWGQTTPAPEPITMESGDSLTGIDFGNSQLGTRICVRAFFDSDHNQQPGDPGDVPMQGVTFTLTGSDTQNVFVGQTDGSGNLCFDELPIDDYLLVETPPEGYETILPKAGVLPISVAGCVQDTIEWLNTAAFTDSLFRTATVQQWAMALDHAGKRKAVKCKPHRVVFKADLAWRDGSVKLKFPIFTRGSLRIGTNKQVAPVATWDSVKVVTVDLSGLGAPGDTVQVDGLGLKGKFITVVYEWRDALLNLMGKGALPGKPDPAQAAVDRLKLNELRYPMPNLHNVGEELERQGAYPIRVGVPADSHSVVHFKYRDVLKSLVKDARGVVTFHTDSTHCLDVFLNGKPMKKQVKSLPPDKANNGLFAEILALKLNIAASQKGKFPPGLDTLIYDYHMVDPTPLDSLSVGEIARMADSLVNCYQDPRGLSLSPLEYYRIIRRINGAFAGAAADTESWSCVKLVVRGVRTLKEVPFLRANPGSLQNVAVPLLEAADGRPLAFALEQNYPNPFNPSTSIQFTIAHAATVTLAVYNTLGQQVALLLDAEALDEGTHELEFDASGLPSGVYFSRLTAEGLQDDEGGIIPGRYVSMRKMVLMK